MPSMMDLPRHRPVAESTSTAPWPEARLLGHGGFNPSQDETDGRADKDLVCTVDVERAFQEA